MSKDWYQIFWTIQSASLSPSSPLYFTTLSGVGLYLRRIVHKSVTTSSGNWVGGVSRLRTQSHSTIQELVARIRGMSMLA